jgi:hypothetical protein
VRAVADGVAAYFDARRRALWAGRLFTLADHLDRGGDPAAAGMAAATARALRAGTDPARIPFARLLVEKAVPAVTAAPQPPAPTQDSLLIQPPR